MINKKVCVIGIWHLGCVTSACLAELGYSVVGVDKNLKRVRELNKGIPPLFEPGLTELLADNLKQGNLRYSTDIKEALTGAEYIVIAFDTAVDGNDVVDLSEIFTLCEKIGKYLENDTVVIVTSQVPVGTCDRIKKLIHKSNPHLRFDIAYVPENLRLGQAIESFNTQQRIVIGANNGKTLDRVEKLFSPLNTVILRMNLRSAEMTKHALNALLGMSISFGNEIANLCDELEVDALQVVNALRMDERIGKKLPLLPGLGFSGATLARDLKVLQSVGNDLNYETYLVDATLKVNDRQNQVVLRKLEKVFGKIKGLQIGILGLTYKPGTSTLRRSAALEIISELVKKGATIKACDPKASREEIATHKEFKFCKDAYAAAKNSDALVLVTEWSEFKDLDFDRIKSLMKRPVFIDAKNMLAIETMSQKGFTYLGVGRGHQGESGK
jgi:UDPglucose 6-dehydrogenase